MLVKTYLPNFYFPGLVPQGFNLANGKANWLLDYFLVNYWLGLGKLPGKLPFGLRANGRNFGLIKFQTREPGTMVLVALFSLAHLINLGQGFNHLINLGNKGFGQLKEGFGRQGKVRWIRGQLTLLGDLGPIFWGAILTWANLIWLGY